MHDTRCRFKVETRSTVRAWSVSVSPGWLLRGWSTAVLHGPHCKAPCGSGGHKFSRNPRTPAAQLPSCKPSSPHFPGQPLHPYKTWLRGTSCGGPPPSGLQVTRHAPQRPLLLFWSPSPSGKGEPIRPRVGPGSVSCLDVLKQVDRVARLHRLLRKQADRCSCVLLGEFAEMRGGSPRGPEVRRHSSSPAWVQHPPHSVPHLEPRLPLRRHAEGGSLTHGEAKASTPPGNPVSPALLRALLFEAAAPLAGGL